jgi:hypothetical protein
MRIPRTITCSVWHRLRCGILPYSIMRCGILLYVGRGVCLGSLFELSDVHVMSRDSARALCIYLLGHRAPDTSSL